MSTSLHTAYRPNVFKDVIGHDAVVKSLRKVVKEGRAHTFLFTGGSGLGKTTLARIVANEFALLGAKSDDATITLANILDVDAATHTGVDAMRSIVQKANYRAIGDSPVKGIIVDECHKLSSNAWDSILKATEEPPKHVYWFFCTTLPGKVPATIKTRCIDYHLKPLSEDEILLILAEVMDKADLKVEDEILELIAENSGGSPRQALTYLEKVEYCETVTDAREALRLAGETKEINDFCQFLMKPKGTWKDAMRICKDMEEANQDAESIRIVTCHYMAKVAAKTTDHRRAASLLRIIECFSTPYDNSAKYAPLYVSIGLVLELHRA